MLCCIGRIRVLPSLRMPALELFCSYNFEASTGLGCLCFHMIGAEYFLSHAAEHTCLHALL